MLFRSDRKSTRLNSSHTIISYAVFCLKKKKKSPSSIKNKSTWGAAKHTRHESLHSHITCATATTTTLDPLHPGPSVVVFFFLKDRGPPETYPFSLHGVFRI